MFKSKMKYTVILIVCLLCGIVSSYASEGISDKEVMRAIADSTIALVRDAHALLVYSKNNNQLSAEEKLKLVDAYELAWKLAIKSWQKSGDERTKLAILDLWNSHLKVGSDEVRIQILALDYVWSEARSETIASPKESPDIRSCILTLDNEWTRAFVSELFVKLFKETKDSMIIHAMCMVLGDHGGEAEAALLQEKKKSLESIADSQIPGYKADLSNIDSALRKIDYWNQGDNLRAGPAAP